ncbi:MAG TPA: pyridoxamine 5'-phosphate oxidase family protein [Gemmatimonadales bacterium]|jgi:uncharacterized protein YhbP (UPF0306 family)|nr:pyridoxamine 5'-phosphate oxidase family protein [Gemmatimonadales bacterium]
MVHARGYDSDRIYASVVRILDTNALCAMATRSESGALHISTAFFCFSPDIVLYFLSHPDSLHCQNLARTAQMAVAVFDSSQEWGDPHSGLQLHGRAGLTDPDASREARGLYGVRFPRYREVMHHALELPFPDSGFRDLKFYRFVPQRAQILDEWEFGEEVFIGATVLR